ncbi:metallophosphoesterase family protein [Microscilla marina]|uniref:Metallophosphoesterase n=1 Tax=Microscilla marina ATCC 23134 TaxID=313606 RepID=A1ZS21_MICM2|nr:metallophosphoesterase family protein [Microscilla marina]EAY26744.1 metallophosphoesterase [Microscilla marina ATCC 23134]
MSLFQTIKKPLNGRRFVVGDVHGCCLTLQQLVWKHLQFTTQDQLFLLGDYIDRGPDGAGVLDFIIGLQHQDYQVYPLRGNHEQMLLTAWESFQQLDPDTKALTCFADKVRDQSMVDHSQDCLLPRFERWLNNLPYYYALDNFYLVHAGFNFRKAAPFEDFYAMLWTMRFNLKRYHAIKAQRKHVVHGHQKTSLPEIKAAVASRAKVIPLDNGCYKHHIEDYGQLCALDIDNWELFYQPNIDFDR